MKSNMLNNLSRTFHKVGFTLKKHSPEILVVAGTVGVVASAVMACKATTKVSAIIEESKENIEAIHKVKEDPEYKDRYSEEDAKKDMAIVYTQTGLKLAKLYGPSVLLGVVSLGCIISSHTILNKRNTALAAAYATIDRGFKEYRNRVIERFGKDLDKELKYNIKSQEIEETTVDEKGKEKKVKTTINVADPNNYSPYSVIYDDGNIGWDKDPEINKYFLIHQQNYANDRLKAKGHLFLNEVYDMLGFPRTKAGQVVGWVYDEKNPIGDNFVDFGIFDIDKPKARDFVNGRERCIILDFNVDGNILDLMN